MRSANSSAAKAAAFPTATAVPSAPEGTAEAALLWATATSDLPVAAAPDRPAAAVTDRPAAAVTDRPAAAVTDRPAAAPNLPAAATAAAAPDLPAAATAGTGIPNGEGDTVPPSGGGGGGLERGRCGAGSKIKVLGCDGTAMNTVACGGACRLFELASETPVHWFVCQIHANELNLGHVFHALDGTTSGPDSWKGPIGRSCQTEVWQKDVVTFTAIAGLVEEMPEETEKQLSTDQELLYRLARAASAARFLIQ